MKTIKNIAILIGLVIFVAACSSDDEMEMTEGNLVLNINGLEDLGSDYIYEGWMIVNGSAITTGTFTVDGNGNLSKTSFTLDKDQVANASTFVLTIEPNPDPDPAPSSVHIVAGDVSAGLANLTIAHGAALGNDFSSATGSYILATPTDGAGNNEKSGVWFLDPSGANPVAGLNLPTLPAGWEYEGWAVIGGTPVTTGKFTSLSGADDAAPYSGASAGPPFPGEDFLMNAPAGLTFPTDLSSAKIVISIEPMPDNSPNPFLLKPLLADVPANALDHTLYTMNNIAASNSPTGTARFSIK
mgnify:CR=1 FL=1